MKLRYPALLVLLCSMVFLQAQPYEFDATILEYRGLRYVCDDTTTPVLRIQNTGAATMNTCVVETWKGGLMVNSFNWELAVPAEPGQIHQPALPAVADVLAGDLLEFRIISVNEELDENDLGNVLLVLLDDEPVAAMDNVMTVALLTGLEPQPFTWQILDELAVVQASGGPYESTLTMHETLVELEAFTCYQIVMQGLGEAGLPMGYLSLHSAGGSVYFLPGELMGTEVVKGFTTGALTTIPEQQAAHGITIAPNPTHGPVLLTPADDRMGMVSLVIFDSTGRSLAHTRNSFQGPVDLDLSEYGSGIFLLVLEPADGIRQVRRVIVQ